MTTPPHIPASQLVALVAEGKTYAELAEIFDTTIGRIARRLYDIRRKHVVDDEKVVIVKREANDPRAKHLPLLEHLPPNTCKYAVGYYKGHRMCAKPRQAGHPNYCPEHVALATEIRPVLPEDLIVKIAYGAKPLYKNKK